MQDERSIAPDACPRCSTRVEGERRAGIWTGFDKARKVGITGTGYAAICKKCGADLYSLPTHEEAEARQFFWQERERCAKQHPQVKREREALLEPLLEAHAERTPVLGSLQLEFADYSVGSGNQTELRKWLFLDQVNDAAMRYPGIFFHMDATTMTWLFFDSEHRLQSYFIRSA